MEYEKQKNIRKLLINYTNQQLILNKKKNKDFLINSKKLEELEKKNMRSKEFFIVEKPLIFQNINNNRSIIQNTYINDNSIRRSIVIYPLSSRIIIDKKMEDINKNNLNNTYREDNSKDKCEIMIKESKNIDSKKKIESPVARSRLIKKELGERKLKITKNLINYYKYLSKNKTKQNKNEEDNNKNNENEIGICRGNSRQLSIETLATEISRIIEIVHHDKNINSFGLSHSDSKIEDNSDIKKAKIYAKKLKYYCRTLKNKYPRDEKIIKLKPLNKIDLTTDDHNNHKIFYNNTDNNENNQEKKNYIKGKRKNTIVNHKTKMNERQKLSEKIKKEDIIIDDNINTVKYRPIFKKLKSERNIESKIKKNSFVSDKNYHTEQSTNNNKTIDNDNKKENKTNFSKSKKKIKKLEKKEIKNIKNNNKSPIKVKKKEMLSNYLIKKIKNKLDEVNVKKVTKKVKKNQKDESHKIESYIIKDLNHKRSSIDTGILGIGKRMETLFDMQKFCSSDEYSGIKNTKKKQCDLNNTENNSYITEQEKISSYKKKKNLKKKNNQTLINNKDNKKKMEEIKKVSNIKKTKTLFIKRSNNELNIIKDNRKFSSIHKEDEKILNNTIDIGRNRKKENSKKITFNLDENYTIKKKKNENEVYKTEGNDDTNIMDEYLYKKKHKRINK